MPFVVDRGHKCFPEVLQFFVHAVSLHLHAILRSLASAAEHS
jgi:hypothetical protein